MLRPAKLTLMLQLCNRKQLAISIMQNAKKTFYNSAILFHQGCAAYSGEKKDALMKYLSRHSIETGIHYPISLSNLNVTTEQLKIVTSCPRSEKASEEVVSLPMYPELTEDQQEYICNHIQDFFSS